MRFMTFVIYSASCCFAVATAPPLDLGTVQGSVIIKGRPFGVGFDRSHLNLKQGASS